MTFLAYIFTGIGTASLFGFSPALGVLFAVLFYLRKRLIPLIQFSTHQSSFETPAAYHQHLFSLLGYLAKADGIISNNEIRVAQEIMQESGLNYTQKAMAQNSFREGSRGLNLNNTISFLQLLSHTQPNLIHTFLAHQERMIHADMHKSIQQVNILNQIKFHVFSQQRHHQQTSPPPPQAIDIHNAYQTLGINRSMDFPSMKKIYRKLIGKHHPDRQRSDADKKTAEEKIKRFHKAWKVVQSHHQKEMV